MIFEKYGHETRAGQHDVAGDISLENLFKPFVKWAKSKEIQRYPQGLGRGREEGPHFMSVALWKV